MAPITYQSTRGAAKGSSFEQVVLGGLAPDGGLFIPERMPTISMDEIESLRGKSYVDVAYAVISKFVSNEDIPSAKLREILEKSFSTFRDNLVTPTLKFKDFQVLELFHGPTFAFKDVALQFLGNVFEHFLSVGKIQSSITILGATSGDTGSAAIYGLRGKKNVNCFILYPKGKVTEIQEKQMVTIPDKNVHCMQVDGNFDDCQALVKAAFADKAFRKSVNLGAINSINWARVLAQITYYFQSWLQITSANKELKKSPISFVVPTGNFGDILAGYYAKQMGLPIGHLVVATNSNDVLHRFLTTGCYVKNQCNPTIAPSMDISVSSNFERYLFYLSGSKDEKLASWMKSFESTGEIKVTPDLLLLAQSDFRSYAANEQVIVDTMKKMYSGEKYLICPHTATAVAAVHHLQMNKDTSVVLATAHPAKFEEACNRALGNNHKEPRPKELQKLYTLPMRRYDVKNDLADVQAFVIKNKCTGGNGLFSFDSAFSIITVSSLLFFSYSNGGSQLIKSIF